MICSTYVRPHDWHRYGCDARSADAAARDRRLNPETRSELLWDAAAQTERLVHLVDNRSPVGVRTEDCWKR